MRLALSFARGEVAALLAAQGEQTGLTARRVFAANASPARQWLDGVEIARDLFFRAAFDPQLLEGVALSFPLPLDASGAVERNARSGTWGGYDLARGLREHFGVSHVAVVTRVEAEARYEASFGALKERENWFYLRLGERLESCACWRGGLIPSQIGALTIEKDGALDEFSRRGTLGAYCSGAAFSSRATSYGITLSSPAQVWGLAATNFAAQAVVEDFTTRLAHGIGGVLAMFGPLPIGIGGAFGREIWPFLEPLLAPKLRDIAPPRSEGFSLALAQGDATAPLWGSLNALDAA